MSNYLVKFKFVIAKKKLRLYVLNVAVFLGVWSFGSDWWRPFTVHSFIILQHWVLQQSASCSPFMSHMDQTLLFMVEENHGLRKEATPSSGCRPAYHFHYHFNSESFAVYYSAGWLTLLFSPICDLSSPHVTLWLCRLFFYNVETQHWAGRSCSAGVEISCTFVGIRANISKLG